MQPPSTLAQITKKRSVSMGLPDQGLPPAGLARHGVDVGDMLVAGERVADEDRVGALCIEAAIGLVGDLPGRQRHARVHREGCIGAEAHDGACRLVGLDPGFLGDAAGAEHGVAVDSCGGGDGL